MCAAASNLGTPSENKPTVGGGANEKTHQQWVVNSINSLEVTVSESVGNIDSLRLALESHTVVFSNLIGCVNRIECILNQAPPSTDNAQVRSTPLGATMSTMENEKSNTSRPTEDSVSTFTKDELNAKLAQNKAEVESVAAGMRTEMANFRTAYVESFKDIAITLSKIDAKADANEKRLTQAQWIISLVISVCAIFLSVMIFFSNKNNIKTTPQPTVVVNATPSPDSHTTPKTPQQN